MRIDCVRALGVAADRDCREPLAVDGLVIIEECSLA